MQSPFARRDADPISEAIDQGVAAFITKLSDLVIQGIENFVNPEPKPIERRKLIGYRKAEDERDVLDALPISAASSFQQSQSGLHHDQPLQSSRSRIKHRRPT